MDRELRRVVVFMKILSRILVFLLGFIVGGLVLPATPSLETTVPNESVFETESTMSTETTMPIEEITTRPSAPGTLPTIPVTSTLFGETPNTKPELFKVRIDPSKIDWYGSYRVKATQEVTTQAGGYDFDREFLAKLLYCEARGSNWEGQVFTCSAILNYCDEHGQSLWAVGHDVEAFSVAPWVDSAKPKEMQYEVVDYVLSGGRIEDICYFRTKHYHNFGVPVCEVDGHYFSMRAD